MIDAVLRQRCALLQEQHAEADLRPAFPLQGGKLIVALDCLRGREKSSSDEQNGKRTEHRCNWCTLHL
ncbi:hypothetical protein PRIPAC_91333 [Pristionchus pacificus]|uniref:Uncharacterized protein n=1 Tax=Pristionchus pacificus TaxID=54126 RepID=A0A2A6B9P7_PRIPA|nr:hypothetical protein PRIPAC_91333 [Pristionchus pacificus]|eukprot:PDM62605.1 hypothetical protein PRIPAC_52047 [Pristionchus pacificus]